MSEETSRKVSSTAGLVNPMDHAEFLAWVADADNFALVKSVVASALTQAADHEAD